MAGARRAEKSAEQGSVLRVVAIGVLALLLVLGVGGFWVYKHLDSNIEAIPIKGLEHRPAKVVKPHVETQPLNILLLGSDTRDGQGGGIGGQTPGLSDTTIVLHVSADRKRAYAVSIPRDSMVQMPSCERKDGNGTYAGGLNQFNEAYAIGGPLCTLATVEAITHVRMDHFVVVDFNGFKKIVDALGGVQICVPQTVDDTVGRIHLDAGTYTVDGTKALDYVRERHALGYNQDIGRMARQQAFLGSMVNKAVSLGTLTNPVKLYNFLDAVTKSITADSGLAHLKELTSLAESLHSIGLDHVRFMTVPWEEYPANHNRVQFKEPEAAALWDRLNNDEPLGARQRAQSTSAKPSTHLTETERQHALDNGLCT